MHSSAAAFLLQDQLLDRQRSTPAMATDRFNPDKHWRKSTQWFVLNRRWAGGEGGLRGWGVVQCSTGKHTLPVGWPAEHSSGSVLRSSAFLSHVHLVLPGCPTLTTHLHSLLLTRAFRHAEVVAHDTELMSVFGRHCSVGEDKELGR